MTRFKWSKGNNVEKMPAYYLSADTLGRLKEVGTVIDYNPRMPPFMAVSMPPGDVQVRWYKSLNAAKKWVVNYSLNKFIKDIK